LGQSALFCEIAGFGGETAFAFAGRDMPDPGRIDAVAMAVDGSSGRQFVISDDAFRPEALIPRITLTVGIALRARDADLSQWSAFQRSLWEKLGPPAERGDGGEFAGFRWDFEYPVHERGLFAMQRTMAGLEKSLIKSGIAYWMAKFDGGWGTISGELDIGEDNHEVGDTYLGPNAIISLDWTDAEGENRNIVANEAEFMTDYCGDLPESEIWSM
jgi:hypothetical protein